MEQTVANPRHFDLFLAYRPADKSPAQIIFAELKRQGLEIRCEATASGETSKAEVASILRQSAACALLFGADGLESLNSPEYRRALELAQRDRTYRQYAKDRALRLCLVFLPGFSADIDPGNLPSDLKGLPLVDLRNGVEEREGLQRLVEVLKGKIDAPGIQDEESARLPAQALVSSYPKALSNDQPSQEISAVNPDNSLEEFKPAPSIKGFRKYILAGAVFLVVLGLAAIALWLAQDALQQRDSALSSLRTNAEAAATAKQEQDKALSRELAANSNLYGQTDPELSLLLALEATKKSPTLEGETALRKALSQPVPRRTQAIEKFGNILAISPDGKRLVTIPEGNYSEVNTVLQVWDTATGALVSEFKGHARIVATAVFSPDSTLIISGGYDFRARVWEVETGKERFNFQFTAPVRDVGFSPDGKYFFASSLVSRIWEAGTGKLVNESGDGLPVFSPDGRRFATINPCNFTGVKNCDFGVTVWDATLFTQLLELQGHKDIVNTVAFSPDGKFLVTGSSDHTGRVWNASTGMILQIIDAYSSEINDVNFSPDGERVVMIGQNGVVFVWEKALGRFDFTTNGSVWGALPPFSPDNRYVLVTLDKVAKLYDSKTGHLAAEYRHATPVKDAIFSPDGRTVITADETGLRFWDVPALVGYTKTGTDNLIYTVQLSPDGTHAIKVRPDGAQVWDVANNSAISILTGLRPPVSAIAFSPDNRLLAGALENSNNSNTGIWETSSGRLLAEFPGNGGELRRVEFSPDGKYLLAASLPGSVRIYDVSSGRLLASVAAHSGQITWAAFSPDGNRFVTTGQDKTAKIWETATGRNVQVLTGHTDWVTGAVFSKDGRYLLTASDDKTARLWNVASGSLVSELKGHTSQIRSLAFSPDGKRLATGGSDGTVLLWDGSTGQLLANLPGFNNTIYSLVFSRDGKLLLAGSTFARVWDGTTGDLLADLVGPGTPLYLDNLSATPLFNREETQVLVALSTGEIQVFDCTVCGDLDQLKAKASSLLSRGLTPQEREKFLHEQPNL